MGRVSGDDHIVSPRQFDVEYVGSAFGKRCEEEGEHPIIQKSLPLRVSSHTAGEMRTAEGTKITIGYHFDKEALKSLVHFIAQAANARADLMSGTVTRETEVPADAD